MRFTDAGPEYQPAGTPHAVDAESEMFIPRAVVDYAVLRCACGPIVGSIRTVGTLTIVRCGRARCRPPEV
jgi:hypothetical protein